MTRVALVVTFVLGFSGAASAETVVLLPATAAPNTNVPRTVLDDVQQGIRNHLRSEGDATVESAACTDLECAAQAATEASAVGAVQAVVWPGGNGEVVVVFVQADGTRFRGSARLSEGPAAAAGHAMLNVARRRSLGVGPWLLIQGEPVGARYAVDGESRGVIPDRIQMTAGQHRIEVTADGYRPQTVVATVGSEPGDEAVVEVVLDAWGDNGNPVDESPSALIPILAGVAGAGVAAVGVYRLLVGVDCDGSGMDAECERPIVVVDILYIGLGLAIAAGGIVYWLLAREEPPPRTSEVPWVIHF